MEGVSIRRYQTKDRAAIRDIAWETAFKGEPATNFFTDKEILADFLTQYFTDYEPEFCFVAEAQGRVIGYLLGAKNTLRLTEAFQERIFPRILLQAIIRGTVLKKKNLIFIWSSLMSFLGGEFKMPDFSKDYPATLHINLKEAFRNQGIGARLMRACLDYLKEEQVAGVRLATLSSQAAEFFTKQGFILLYQAKRSYFRYLLGKDIPIYIFGKRIL